MTKRYNDGRICILRWSLPRESYYRQLQFLPYSWQFPPTLATLAALSYSENRARSNFFFPLSPYDLRWEEIRLDPMANHIWLRHSTPPIEWCTVDRNENRYEGMVNMLICTHPKSFNLSHIWLAGVTRHDGI